MANLFNCVMKTGAMHELMCTRVAVCYIASGITKWRGYPWLIVGTVSNNWGYPAIGASTGSRVMWAEPCRLNMMSLPTTTGGLSWQPLQECLCLLTHGLGSRVRGVMCTHLSLPPTYTHIYTHIYTYVHTNTHICTHMQMHKHARKHTGRCIQMYIHEEVVFFLAASSQYIQYQCLHPWLWLNLWVHTRATFVTLSTISPLHLTSVPISLFSLLLYPSRRVVQPVYYYNSCNQSITIISMSLL